MVGVWALPIPSVPFRWCLTIFLIFPSRDARLIDHRSRPAVSGAKDVPRSQDSCLQSAVEDHCFHLGPDFDVRLHRRSGMRDADVCGRALLTRYGGRRSRPLVASNTLGIRRTFRPR
jgi:hypothetical protein